MTASTSKDNDSGGHTMDSRPGTQLTHRPQAGSKPIRVLYVDHTAKIGGGEVAIFNLVSVLDRSRFTPVFVLASEGPLATRLRNASVETHILMLDPSVNDTRKDSLGLASLLKLKAIFICISYVSKLVRLMRELDIQLVHTNSLKAHLVGGIAARIARLPVVWHVRDNIDEIYLPAIVSRVIRWTARWMPTYVIANSNSTLKNLCLDPEGRTAVVYSGVRLGQGTHSENQRRVVHDGVASESYASESYASESYASESYASESYASESYASDMAKDPLKRPLNLPDAGGHCTVAMVGRIAEWKGQHIFIEAASQVLKSLPKTTFQIIGAPLFGEHEYERSLHTLVERLGIESAVEFLGFREDVALLVAQCDLLVHASIIGEPFGQVVVEGMAAGKPVIATRGGALPEIVVHGETGLLVEMGDASDMATQILSLLAEPQKACAMGEAGRQRALEKFSITASAAKIHEVYETMLSSN